MMFLPISSWMFSPCTQLFYTCTLTSK